MLSAWVLRIYFKEVRRQRVNLQLICWGCPQTVYTSVGAVCISVNLEFCLNDCPLYAVSIMLSNIGLESTRKWQQEENSQAVWINSTAVFLYR